ncbi:MAG: mechanosensitive ion channel family protein [Faecalibacterium sp.]|jgi:MscS family membrane protein|nr:mechanosensitive ion channel family protein [Faecalibacterium sp.]
MLFSFEDATFCLAGLRLEGLYAALAQMLFAGALAAIFWAGSRLFKFVILPRLLKRTAKSTRWKALHILLRGFSGALPMAMWATGLYIGLIALPWSDKATVAAHAGLLLCYRIVCILLAAQGLWGAAPLCSLVLGSAASRLDMKSNRTLSAILEKIYRVLVLAFCAITVLDELGYPVTGLVTGVGLAGLTVSLAAKESAGNLFSGLVILLEHPFGIGDWIKVGDVEGTVEDLTFRSTKVRALDNSLYILPNSTVCSADVNNGTNRTKRMFRFTLGVTYDTTRAQLETLMADLAAMLRTHEEVEAGSVLVELAGFGDSSIDILVHCYVLRPEMAAFLAVQNTLNLDIMDVMQRDGVAFAFPSTSVYLEKTPSAEKRL